MFAMHAPDGFLEPWVAVATGLISMIIIGSALKASGREFAERQVPLAGIAAAFIFAAQMFNFPVAAGTTGHLLGGCMAAILLGPWIGSVVVAVVVVVQALLFADGGLTALGYNVLNMAIVPAFGGWALYWLCRRFLPSNAAGVVGATGLAAGMSVVLSSMAFSIEWLFGATAPVAFDTVFAAMVGVHVLIGVGEGVISALVVASVVASRPDLVAGARDLAPEDLIERPRVGRGVFVFAGVAFSVLFAAVVSQCAVDNPDGLEKVAIDKGFVDSARDHAFDNSVFADYATRGINNETLSLAVAGLAGAALTLLVGYGLARASRHLQPLNT